MSDFQNEMNRVVQGFVAQITELARRAAIDTLESAFGGRSSGRSAPVAAAQIGNSRRDVSLGAPLIRRGTWMES